MLVHIDGSKGEGGGQVLRSALALSLATKKGFRIEKIRAKRKSPGLMRQHLTAVRLAAQISNAEVSGAELNSQQLTFVPQALVPGDHSFSIGTAGSTLLVLQAVLPALIVSKDSFSIRLKGGTHNPMAPPYDFFELALLPQLRALGANVESTLVRAGFYPAGGGELVVSTRPAEKLVPLSLLERGAFEQKTLRALVGQLPFNIAQREVETARAELDWADAVEEPRTVKSTGPGNIFMAILRFSQVTEVFSCLGERGVPAEVVARKASDEVKKYLSQTFPVGEHLADQLLVPLALAAGGAFDTGPLTDHSLTQIMLTESFLGTSITTENIDDFGSIRLRVAGR